MKPIYSAIAVVSVGAFGFLMGYVDSRPKTVPKPTAEGALSAPPNLGESPVNSGEEKDEILGRVMSMALSNTAPVGLFDEVEKMSLSQIREALARIDLMPGGSDVAQALNARLVRLDPSAGAAQFAKSGDGVALPKKTLLIRAWARQAPDEAWAAAIVAPGSGRSRVVLEEVVKALAVSNPEEAISRLSALEDTGQRDGLLANCLYYWAGASPGSATNWVINNLERIPSGEKGSEAINSVVSEIAFRNPKQASLFVEQLPPALADSAINRLLSRWAAMNPVEALEYADQKGFLESRGNAAATILSTGLSRAPKQTVDWVAARPPGPERDKLIATAMSRSSHSPGAAKMLFPLLADEGKARSVGTYMKSEFDGSPEKAKAFAVSQSSPDVQNAAFRAYARDFSSPKILAEIEQTSPGKARDSMRLGYVEGISETKPEEAAAEFLKLPTNVADRDLAVTILVNWWRVDRKKADAWMKENQQLLRGIRSQ